MSAALGTTPGRRDGVCANVDFPSPGRLVADAVAAASGIDPDADPWRPERAVWPLLEIVDASLDEPWLSALAATSERRGPAGAPVRQRPPRRRPVRPLRAVPAGDAARWAARRGRPLAGASCGGGCATGSPVARARPSAATPPAARLRERAERADLPRRLSLFGLTRLPAGHLEVLHALAAQRDVHLFLLHPSPALVGAARSGHAAGAGAGATTTADRADQPAARLLGARRARAAARPRAREHVDHHHAGRAPPDTLLARVPGLRTSGTRPPPPAPDHRRGRPQPPGPRVPRPRPPGRGPARRDPAPARRRPDARAARRDRHVPGHRGVRAADPWRRSAPASDEDEDRVRRRRAARPARPARRPLAAPDQPGARRRRPAARPRRRAADRLAGARPRRPRARAPALPLDDDDLARMEEWVAGERDPLGARRRAPRAVQARAAAERHVARRARPAAARRDDDRGRPAAVRRRAAARRRRERRDRPRRPLRRAVDRLQASVDALADAEAVAELGGARSRAAADALTATRAARRLAARGARSACSTTS